ncbi:hypothetical protein [Nonlabens tegetincola]|uniref:hypothetical protein n=1 Tax=Nonlabens tegetincola TaxID=323273 RepID=UPI0011B03C02|nr:hypothetical protein [Nonlabens tegetincola]
MNKSFKNPLLFLLYSAVCCTLFYYIYTTTKFVDNKEDTSTKNLQLEQEKSFTETSNTEILQTDSLIDNSIKVSDSISKTKKEDVSIDNTVSGVRDEAIKEERNLYYDTVFKIINPDDSVAFDCGSQVKMYYNQAKIKLPFNCSRYGVTVKELLEKYPTNIVTIHSYQDENEVTNAAENRGNYIARLLRSTGISRDRILVRPHVASIPFENGMAASGIKLIISSK